MFLCVISHGFFSSSSSVSQIVRHGGALGLGLAALGTARQDVYDLLKSNLYQDDAVTGAWALEKFKSLGVQDILMKIT